MLTPEKIAQFDQITGLKTPQNAPGKSRGAEIRELAAQARKAIPVGNIYQKSISGDKGIIPSAVSSTMKTYADLPGKLSEDVKAGAEDIQKGNVLKGVTKAGLRTSGDVAGAVFAPVTGALGATLEKTGIQGVIDKMAKVAGDKISDFKPLQEFALKHPNAEEDLNRAMNLILGASEKGSIEPKRMAGEIKTKVSEIPSTVKNVVEQGKESIDEFKANRSAKIAKEEAQNVDKLTGTIIQGEKGDIQAAKKSLGDIDTEQVKSYADLKDVLDDKIKGLSGKLDTELGKSPIHNKPVLLANWDKITKVGGKTVSHNYVEDALGQLKDHYSKINDVENATRVEQLISKAEDEGLTIKDVNDIAREHGQNLNAYNASGELASGLKKQAAENTRKGLKDTAREFYGDEGFKATDEQISNLINTRDLVEKVSENVNKLKQKVTERGMGEKIGRLVFQVTDKLTGGGLKGFIQSFVPRGEGLKIMNALDLEKALQKNLKKLQDILKSDLSEKTMEKKLKDILDS